MRSWSRSRRTPPTCAWAAAARAAGWPPSPSARGSRSRSPRRFRRSPAWSTSPTTRSAPTPTSSPPRSRAPAAYPRVVRGALGVSGCGTGALGASASPVAPPTVRPRTWQRRRQRSPPVPTRTEQSAGSVRFMKRRWSRARLPSRESGSPTRSVARQAVDPWLGPLDIPGRALGQVHRPIIDELPLGERGLDLLGARTTRQRPAAPRFPRYHQQRGVRGGGLSRFATLLPSLLVGQLVVEAAKVEEEPEA